MQRLPEPRVVLATNISIETSFQQARKKEKTKNKSKKQKLKKN